MRTNVVQAFGLVATPGIFVPFYMIPQRARFDHPFAYNWILLSDYYFFVMFSMVVMGFVMVFEWDALFPDRKDYLILTPLPLGGGSIFAGKTLAPGGDFLVKVFQGRDFQPYVQQLRGLFATVKVRKPPASRQRSPELYLLARTFNSG